MALAADFELFITTTLNALSTLDHGVPSGVPAQCAELGTLLDAYDKARAQSDTDPRLSPNGRQDAAQNAANVAREGITKWSSRVDGLERQMATLQQALLVKSGATIPQPSALRVQALLQRVADLDPLEVKDLYLGAPAEDQRALEVVSETVGRQPVKRDGRLVWEELLDAELVTQTVLVRADRTDAAGAAQLRDLQRLRNAFASLAASARQLVDASLQRVAA